jgi:hypothetical protein
MFVAFTIWGIVIGGWILAIIIDRFIGYYRSREPKVSVEEYNYLSTLYDELFKENQRLKELLPTGCAVGLTLPARYVMLVQTYDRKTRT